MTARYGIVEAGKRHCWELAPRLRPADAAAIEALGELPLDGLLRMVETSAEAWAGLVDGRTACLFGAWSPALLGPATVWAATSGLVVAHRRVFLRASRRWVGHMRHKHGRLECWIDERHTVARRWLRWLGFEEDGMAEMLPTGVQFLRCATQHA